MVVFIYALLVALFSLVGSLAGLPGIRGGGAGGGEFESGLVAAIEMVTEMSFPSPHPHLQIRHRGPDVALGPFRDLAGDGDGTLTRFRHLRCFSTFEGSS